MGTLNFLNQLVKLEQEDLYEHIFHLYVEHKPTEKQHLGYVDKSVNLLSVSLPNAHLDLNIEQSLTSLSSATESSSTGFVCWQGAVNFADWALADAKCPFREILDVGSPISVLELGAGVGATLVSVFGPNVARYIASDQKHVLKLLKSNFANNVVSQRYHSTTSERAHAEAPRKREDETWSTIDFIEFDWEHLDAGKQRYLLHSGGQLPDVILASDTIYNSHLIPHFVKAMKEMMSSHTVALVTIQLRDEDVTEQFLDHILHMGLVLYAVPDELLDKTLLEGFMVYCIQRENPLA